MGMLEFGDGSGMYFVNDINLTGNFNGISKKDIPKYLRMLSL